MQGFSPGYIFIAGFFLQYLRGLPTFNTFGTLAAAFLISGIGLLLYGDPVPITWIELLRRSIDLVPVVLGGTKSAEIVAAVAHPRINGARNVALKVVKAALPPKWNQYEKEVA